MRRASETNVEKREICETGGTEEKKKTRAGKKKKKLLNEQKLLKNKNLLKRDARDVWP